MEALAGVALAGNILQFLQLSLNIVSKGKAYKRAADGSLKEHSDLRMVIVDLDQSIARLETSENEGLRTLVERCKEAGVELSNMLKKVAAGSTQGKLFSSYRQALRAQWHEKDIEHQKSRLEVLRTETSMHIQILMKYLPQAKQNFT